MKLLSRDIIPSIRVYSILLLVICTLTIVATSGFASAAKTDSQISIGMDPADPGPDTPFTISGVLTDADGNILGNKKITLERSKTGRPDDDYIYVAITSTDIKGEYSFFRPTATPEGYLRVRFNGNSQFEGTESDVVLPGKGTFLVKEQTSVAPAVTKTKTLLTAKAPIFNPGSMGHATDVSGQLMAEDGTPLGGKKVILESSDRVGTRSDFNVLAITETDPNGFYKFTTTGGPTTVFVRVRFAGDNEFEDSVTDVMTLL